MKVTLSHIDFSKATVVMLGFSLCQFYTGSLAWRLCLLSSSKFFVWLFQFNICSLGEVGEV